MQDLLQSAIAAHGGMDRWNNVGAVSARAVLGGPALEQRALAFTRLPTFVTASTRRQRVEFAPFMATDRKAVFEPDRTAVTAGNDTPVEELANPRASFADWVPGTPWRDTQTAYFAGYALWAYLNLPFLLARDKFVCKEVEPLREKGEIWRALAVVFPPSYAAHSAEQTLYFDGAGLMRRNDYTVEISGGVQVAHYLYDHRSFGGILFPTRRRINLRNPDRTAQMDKAIITADFDRFELAPVLW